jgi:GST-like protein
MIPAAIHGLLQRWPPQHRHRVQLYSQPSPNGVKVSIMLEECGFEYDAHRIEFGPQGTRSPEYLAANPNGKIPLLLDPAGPEQQPLLLAESNAIVIYLADKTGCLLARAGAARYEALQWLNWQASAVGPTFGNVGYYLRFEGREIADPRPLARHVAEARRLLGLMDARLAQSAWLLGDTHSIVDIATLGMVRNLIGYYGAAEVVGFDAFRHVARWLEQGLARPAVQRGLAVPPTPSNT